MLLADDPQIMQLVRDGGPFAVAFAILVIAFIVFWRLVGKPSLDSLLTISGNFKEATHALEENSKQQRELIARHEAVVDRLEVLPRDARPHHGTPR